MKKILIFILIILAPIIAILAGEQNRIELEKICKKYDGKMLNNITCVRIINGKYLEFSLKDLQKLESYKNLFNK